MGTRLYELNKFADAAAEYEQAYQAKDDPALLFNIGQAYRFDGQNKKALLAYKQYLRKLPNAGNRSEVEKHIAALERLVEDEKHSATSPPTETLPVAHEAPAAAVVAAVPPPPARTPVYKVAVDRGRSGGGRDRAGRGAGRRAHPVGHARAHAHADRALNQR
jgi:tetratricopeptide (TPR) repeat protein